MLSDIGHLPDGDTAVGLQPVDVNPASILCGVKTVGIITPGFGNIIEQPDNLPSQDVVDDQPGVLHRPDAEFDRRRGVERLWVALQQLKYAGGGLFLHSQHGRYLDLGRIRRPPVQVLLAEAVTAGLSAGIRVCPGISMSLQGGPRTGDQPADGPVGCFGRGPSLGEEAVSLGAASLAAREIFLEI